MKVTEIIENPLQEWLTFEATVGANAGTISPGGIAIPTGSTTHLPPSSTPKASGTGNWKSPLGPMPKTNIGKMLSKDQIWSKVKTTLASSPINKAPLSSKGLKVVGNYIRVAQWFNYYDFLVEYWKTKEVIEQMVKDGPDKGGLSEDDGEVAIRLQREKLYVDLISGGIINSIVIKMIKVIPLARWFSRGAGALLEIFTGGLATAGVVGEILLVEAVTVLLQKWLNSEDGKRVITWCVCYLIDPGVELFWQMGCERFFGELKHMSTQGDENLEKGNKVNGTPASDLITKAGNAVSGALGGVAAGAGDWVSKNVSKDAGKAITDLGKDSSSSSSSSSPSTPSGSKSKINQTSDDDNDGLDKTNIRVRRPGDIDQSLIKPGN